MAQSSKLNLIIHLFYIVLFMIIFDYKSSFLCVYYIYYWMFFIWQLVIFYSQYCTYCKHFTLILLFTPVKFLDLHCTTYLTPLVYFWICQKRYYGEETNFPRSCILYMISLPMLRQCKFGRRKGIDRIK